MLLLLDFYKDVLVFHLISEIVECKYIYLMSDEDRSININNIKDIFDKYEI
jgi:hypothetical protein